MISRLRFVRAAGMIAFAIVAVLAVTACRTQATFTPSGPGDSAAGPGDASPYHVPLDPESPWPKFKGNALQTSRVRVGGALTVGSANQAERDEPAAGDERDIGGNPPSGGELGVPWSFQTGRGIFSPPVIDGDGTIYVGSADHRFYAINRDGKEKWRFLTGDIIDSAALLDDTGRVYVPSGDGHLYALDRESGEEQWRFAADTPAELAEEGIRTFIRWFEGHVAMTADGTLVVPNDNFLIYGINRNSGEEVWRFETRDMNWGLPAYNPASNALYVGSVYVAFRNFYAFDATTGDQLWAQGTLGSMVASPLVTSAHAEAAVIGAGFDGFVRAFHPGHGRELWKFAGRDHFYASPAQLSDGTIVIPSADGTVYALDPATGEELWAFDTREPIRSSPSVDGSDRIYVGSGEGRIFCLNANGTLHWSYLAISDLRNDINSSPALGHEAVVVGAENGEVVRVPFEYPRSVAGRQDPRVTVPDPGDTGERLPDDGAHVLTIGRFGDLQVEPPTDLTRNEPIAFRLLVREAGDTVLATIDKRSLVVNAEPAQSLRIDHGANGRYLTAIPNGIWKGDEAGSLTLTVSGTYSAGHRRLGLKTFGGRTAGEFSETFKFELVGKPGAAAAAGATTRFGKSATAPYTPAGTRPGDVQSIIDLGRLAAPIPTILPSYNQIGFDSIHYLLTPALTAPGTNGNGGVPFLWGVGASLESGTDRVTVNPSLNTRFVLDYRRSGELLTLSTREGFTLEFNGWQMPYDLFRVATRIDPETGTAQEAPAVSAVVRTGDIDFYGPFLKILGFSEWRTGIMNVVAAADLRPLETTVPEWVRRAGSVTLRREGFRGRRIVAEIDGVQLQAADHVFSIMLVDAATGEPLSLDYAQNTQIEVDEATGRPTRISVVAGRRLPNDLRAWYWVDTFPIERSVEVE